MDWNFTANGPAELAAIGNSLLRASKQGFLDEQIQMTRLIESLSAAPIWQLPLRVRHTGEHGVPDFQLQPNGC